tara:strand:+ start:384 stop:536 length:153 start_codon:yes stop_codon:yes gene_type:complete
MYFLSNGCGTAEKWRNRCMPKKSKTNSKKINKTPKFNKTPKLPKLTKHQN